MQTNRLIRYIREAARLRHAINLNEADFDFAERGNKIHYILDTNVVAMFMDPASGTEHLGPFSYWLDEDTRVATATLTAEYLLSKSLPGHDPAQPSIMAPDHFEEVISLAARAAREIEGLDEDAYRRAELDLQKRRLEVLKFSELISNSKKSYSHKVGLLKRQMPGLIQHLVDGPLAEIVQLQRALAGNNLSRMDTQPWYCLTERPSHSLEAEWLQRIERAGRSRHHGAIANQSRTYNYIADARSLALITEIISEYSSDTTQRFLFVTADNTLLQATENFIRQRISRGGEPSFQNNVFVRHPREFLPLLNLSTIHSDPDFRSVFERLKGVLDLLLTGIGPVTSEGNFFRAPSNGKLRYSLANQGSSSDVVDELESLWASASRTAVASSVTILRGRHENMFEALAKLIESQDIKRDIQQSILGDLDRLIKDHSGLTVQGIFEAIERQINRLRNSGFRLEEAVLRITPNLIDPSVFADLVPGGDLEEMLRDAARGADQSKLHQRLASRASDKEACLLLACLCLAVGLWEAARDYARKARSSMRTSNTRGQIQADINYIFAATSRLSLRSYDDYRMIENVLIEDISSSNLSKNKLLEQRAKSELAALRIGVVEQAWIAECESGASASKLIKISKSEQERILEMGAEDLNSLRINLEGFSGDLHGLERLQVQVAVNSAAYSILTTLAFLPRFRNLLDVRDDVLLSELEDFIKSGRSISPVTEPYWISLRALQPGCIHDIREESISRLDDLVKQRFLPRTDTMLMKLFASELRRLMDEKTLP